MKLRITPIRLRGDLLDARKISRAVENALEGAAKAAKADFGVVTQTWKHKPTFRIERKTGERKVYTTDEVFGFVDSGTRAHKIRAKGKKPLRFRRNSSPKTQPRNIGSTQGGRSGPWVAKRVVNHPGTKAREFTTVIAEKWDKALPDVLQRAIDSEA